MKFKIGDKAYKKTTKVVDEKIGCPFCRGYGYVKYGNEKLECDSCDGSGKYILEHEVEDWEDYEVFGVGRFNNGRTEEDIIMFREGFWQRIEYYPESSFYTLEEKENEDNKEHDPM